MVQHERDLSAIRDHLEMREMRPERERDETFCQPERERESTRAWQGMWIRIDY